MLDAEAISAVLSENRVGKSPAEVEAWVGEHGAERKYFADTAISVDDPQWPVLVNAPKLLGDLFDALSTDAPLQYRKVVHSVALTEWLIENKPETLRELVDYIVRITGLPDQ